MSVLVISGIIGCFVNTLTEDEKYSLRNRTNLPQSIQINLSVKEKNVCQFFAAFLKSTSHFEHFAKQDDPRRLFIFAITDWKKRG